MKLVMFFYDFLLFLVDLPLRSWNFLLRKIGRKKIFTTHDNVSDSESTDYSAVVRRAVIEKKTFKSFRRNFYYRQILEHVNYPLGLSYYKLLTDDSILTLNEHLEIKSLSAIGAPRKYYFPRLGWVSPTVIRYQYVSQELQRLFGSSIGDSIAEIGVGFGGQYVLLEKNFNFRSYAIFDLPEVIDLTHMVVSASGAIEEKIVDCNIESPKLENCDLVISNYAFSELPREIQLGYIEGVIRSSKRGYLIMNSGDTNFSGRSSGKFSLEELRQILPPFEVIPEFPLTGPDNYVIVWGHR